MVLLACACGLGCDLARGLRQRVANLLLAVRGARARLFPLAAQRGGHRTERLRPGREALLVARGQFGLQVRRSLGGFRRRLHEPVDFGDRVAGVGLRLGRDVARGLHQHFAHLLLTGRGARARLLPFAAQRSRHRTE